MENKARNIINSLKQTKTFNIEVFLNKEISTQKANHLTLNQYQKIIESVVDNVITQQNFNETMTSVCLESLNLSAEDKKRLTILDRLLFVLRSRSVCISNKYSPQENVSYDLNIAYDKILSKVKQTPDVFLPKTSTEDNITITYGVATLEAESKLNTQIYSKETFKLDTDDEIKLALGKTFTYEIAKSVYSISFNEETVNLAELTFEERIELVQNIPLTLVQHVIDYVELYKKELNECLVFDQNFLELDAGLFSIRT
jgi:hypothetical protein